MRKQEDDGRQVVTVEVPDSLAPLIRELAQGTINEAAFYAQLASLRASDPRGPDALKADLYDATAGLYGAADTVDPPKSAAAARRSQERVARLRVSAAQCRARAARSGARPVVNARPREHRSVRHVSRRTATATSGASSGDPDQGGSDPPDATWLARIRHPQRAKWGWSSC